MGEILTKTCFSPQSEPHTAKLSFSVVLKHFWENSQRNSLFIQKMAISERRSEIHKRFVFLNMFEKGKILRKIWICLNNCFWQTSKSGQILTNTVFLSTFSHIQLNYAFLFFWNILWDIHRHFSFYSKNWLSQNRAQTYSENLFF